MALIGEILTFYAFQFRHASLWIVFAAVLVANAVPTLVGFELAPLILFLISRRRFGQADLLQKRGAWGTNRSVVGMRIDGIRDRL